jgi:hypothetical protein
MADCYKHDSKSSRFAEEDKYFDQLKSQQLLKKDSVPHGLFGRRGLLPLNTVNYLK